MPMSDSEQATGSKKGGETQTPTRKKIDSHMLFEGKNEVVILHQGEEYLLRITKQKKLILTK